MLTFPEAIEIYCIGIDVGFDCDDDIFAKNNWLKRATVHFSAGESIELSFSDRRGVQVLDIDPVEITYIRIVIKDVRPGTKYDDTCLAEIEIWVGWSSRG